MNTLSSAECTRATVFLPSRTLVRMGGGASDKANTTDTQHHGIMVGRRCNATRITCLRSRVLRTSKLAIAKCTCSTTCPIPLSISSG